MFEDARRLTPGTRPLFDVCIVGAGAAGITLALGLAGRGLKIIMLESGGRRASPAGRDLAGGETRGQPYFPLADTRLRRFGGTTGWWTGECRPLDVAEDLAPRPWLGHPGWPIDPCQLETYYARAAPLCGLDAWPFDPPEPWFVDAGLEPLPLPPDRFSTRVFGYSGRLDFAAAHGAALERATDVIVLFHATATGLATSPDGTRVEAVRCATLGGGRFEVAASVVVLATGGIENARLLLASNDRRPAGLGNDHDQVGRCFMEHLFFDDVARFTPSRALPQIGLYGRRHRLRGASVKATLAPTAASLITAGLPNLCFKFASSLKRRRGITAAMALRDCLRSGFPPSGRAALLKDLLVDGPASALALLRGRGERDFDGPRGPRPLLVTVVAEQLPNAESRVRLGASRDALGQRAAQLDWRLAARDRTAWRDGLRLLRDTLAEVGLGQLEILIGKDAALERLRGGRHHMGTTRMSADPRHGVVDANCRVHGVANLFVAGSSVFPTGGHANPTLTIVALALRLAEHLGS